MKYILLLSAFVFTVGCSEDSFEVAPPVAPRDPVDEMISVENAYREFVGQPLLTQGVSCALYTVAVGSPGIVGTALTHVTTYGMVGEFNQPDSLVSSGLNILPPAIRSLYTQWYVVRCSGKLVITQTDYYVFDLTSDDGSMLYVGGSTVINNDGNHSVTTKSGFKLLRKGVHDFRLDYMQGPAGRQALTLKMSGSLLNRKVLYH